jgi:endonuclease-8
VREARNYGFEFLEWKQAHVLSKHWLVHNKGICPRCAGRLTRTCLGALQRRAFFRETCQVRYPPA